jgi:hypothetical protein
MVFGWSVKSTVGGSTRSGRFGDVAVVIASFPTLVHSVFTEVSSEKGIASLAPRTDADLSEFTAITARSGIDVQGLMRRANKAALEHATGWRILVGAFTVDGQVENAALALSPELEIVKIWVLTEDAIDGKEPQPPDRKFVHGFDILSDGSVVFSFDGGVSLQRIDRCGSRIWAIGGDFHHAVTLDDSEEFAWTLLSRSIVKVAMASGEIVQRFSADDIIAANPGIDILQVRQMDNNDLGGNSRNTSEEWLDDPFHFNDVDPLPAALAYRFEGFQAGDLLLSARSLNLIFVVDPGTLEVTWWRSGAVRRQHDPDWGQMGEITVYDNRMSRDYSKIVSIAPDSFSKQTLFDGSVNEFYSRIRGKHQFTDAGNLLITSAQQGRVFEVDRNGEVVLEILNTKSDSDSHNYTISEAIWLSPATFNFSEDVTCEKS